MDQFKKLSNAHLRLFVSILVQNETVFRHFEGQLTVAHFGSEHFQLLYRVVFDFVRGSHRLPTEAELYSDIESYYESDPELITEDAQVQLEEFLNFAFDADNFGNSPPSCSKMESFAYKAGKTFLLESLRESTAFDLGNIESVENLSAFFQSSARQAEILAHLENGSGTTETFATGWDKTNPLIIKTTGLDFFDKYMSGGAAMHEVYGLMAPYGTCKTTLAVMLWCLAAQQCYSETLEETFDEETSTKGLSFLVTYEAPLSNEIRYRALMYAANIHRTSFERMGHEGLSALSDDADNPLPYENKAFKREISDGVFKPERKRVEEAIPYLNEHTVCLDFTGADPEWPNAGTMGISEIVSRIELELKNRGKNYYVKNVIIDYFGLLVDRDITLGETKREEDYKIYQKQVGEISRLLSKKFDCHTWVLHQLSGAANAILSPTKQMHHTDAKGSKSFGENLDFAFVVGNLNLEQIGQVSCTKRRRSRPHPPTIIRVEGEFNRVYSPDNYHVDHTGKIVDKDTAQAVGLGSAAATSDLYADLLGGNDDENLSNTAGSFISENDEGDDEQ